MKKLVKDNLIWIIAAFFIIFIGVIFIGVFKMGRTTDANRQHTPIVFVSDQNHANKTAKYLNITANRDGAVSAMKINVYNNGKIFYHPSRAVFSRFPMIRVNFKDVNTKTDQQSDSLNQILTHLNYEYGYQKYDAVGFGAGALAIFQNACRYGAYKNHMEMSKFVSIAGPFAGSLNSEAKIKNRYPDFSAFEAEAPRFPLKTGVLNIFGSISKKRPNDGLISATSAARLSQLVPRSNYQQLKITGKNGLHFRLAGDQLVQRMIGRFLFAQ